MSNRPSYREEVEMLSHEHTGRSMVDEDMPTCIDLVALSKMITVVLGLLLFIVLVLYIVGNACSAEVISESTCKVCEFERADGSTTAYGSGVLVAKAGEFAFVLTAKHVVNGEGDKRRVVMFPASGAFAYPVLSVRLPADEQTDLAVLRIHAPTDINPRPIRWQPLATGEKVWQSGFGAHDTGGPRESWSNVLPRVQFTASGKSEFTDPSLLLLSKPARHGDSGGPVIDARGRVVGIMSATDKRNGYHVTLADQEWLKAALPENSILVQP